MQTLIEYLFIAVGLAAIPAAVLVACMRAGRQRQTFWILFLCVFVRVHAGDSRAQVGTREVNFKNRSSLNHNVRPSGATGDGMYHQPVFDSFDQCGAAVALKLESDSQLGKKTPGGELQQPVQFRPLVNSLTGKRDRQRNDSGASHAASREILSTPTTLIDRLAWIESRNDPSAIGDNGRSLGAWQLTAGAVADVNKLRRAQGLPEVDHEMVHDLGIGREIAVQYLGILSNQFRRAVGKPPTERQLIGLYQHGFKGGSRRGFLFKDATIKGKMK